MSKPTISSNLLVSFGTAPLLVALVAGKALTAFVQSVGQASEEIFRGDRLPVLPQTWTRGEHSEENEPE